MPQRQYVDRLIAELAAMVERFALAGRTVSTIFFGGGTPSMLEPRLLGELLSACSLHWKVPGTIEVTCEANPETLTHERLQGLRAAGINRLSMGVQSFHPHHLKFLERVHSADRAIAAARDVRRAGFDNFNIDLIYGLPGQTMEECCADIDQAVALAPTHLSAYHLTVEERTPLAAQVRAGRVVMPEEESVLAMWDAVRERLARAGYPAYEISNHAQPGFACRHNLNYWEYGDYLGLGTGACSFVKGVASRQSPVVGNQDFTGDRRPETGNAVKQPFALRFQRARNLHRYLAGELALDVEDPVTREMAMGECAFLALRTERGLSEARFRALFHCSPLDIFGDLFQQWETLGLLGILRQAMPAAWPANDRGLKSFIINRQAMPAAWPANGRGLKSFIINRLPLREDSDRRWFLTPAGRRIANTLSAELVAN